jgi:predicted permease
MVEFTRLLGGTVGLLLLIGSVTVGMLLLVRTEARRDEFAMCLALGASRGQLAAGVTIEGALLSLAGVVLAIPLAGWLLNGVRAFQLPGGIDLERLAVGIDARAFVSAAACAVVVTLVITALAGIAGFRADISDALRSRAGATPRLSRRRTRALLVATQVAVALVLVAGSTLFVRSTIAALQLNPGFETSRILTGSIALPRAAYDPARARGFFEAFQQRIGTNPAVAAVSMSIYGSGMSAHGHLTIDGESREMPSNVAFPAVDDRYFAAMGLRILEGRGFATTETEASPLVAIVSESYGRFIAHGASPIGHRITMPYYRPPAPPAVAEIVGVVPDVITRVTDLQPFGLYFAIAQQPGGLFRTPVIRVASDASVSGVRRDIVTLMRELDGSLIPTPFTTIDEQLMRQMAPQRFGALVMGTLGTIAVLLTMLGAYVLSESMAVMRMRELGIRAALGATRRQLGAVVLAETGRLVGGGIVAGLFLAWMGTKTIRSFLFHVAPLDPPTLAIVSASILSLALAVSLRPALRAARVDLARVLKQE